MTECGARNEKDDEMKEWVFENCNGLIEKAIYPKDALCLPILIYSSTVFANFFKLTGLLM